MSFPTQIRNEQEFRLALLHFLGDINVGLVYTKKFFKEFMGLDNSVRQILVNQIKNALKNPGCGKFMSHNYKGEKAVRVDKRYRLHFKYDKKENLFELVSFYKKDYQ
ncbi:hypothetical protein mru_0763 [Methanobrevibacter ruminantium M1]|uniref:Type II toxin-antitoxin system RelE/ParE family toxin n=1 Tax=Methanobrevibacter ruminantium (strain ATCC 35063 / DSM 1093 / JCM 13430 / OCM 146 / M1) TaxID=634498 RepID=D3E253_METRM|nr:hypothetical protein [Methanobrevibacter ruminantium]ADC46614.1 hypothetical protein mru_0763 [Methanobrevibacter ruminantium M1]